ncbi:MAG TPA: DUF4416 family protein [Smithella sp.]|nr:DUF4416 family protein [Smithella sp.]HNY50922.1 DUF4416 family protein [Smithella sp.]HOG90994.1 DUF4416 family protein [Smithella sp.]HOU51174.1 DUF4416 family protein [Smithella sp.]HQI72713.1 DUF4416 family protein [Smithella sp.]
MSKPGTAEQVKLIFSLFAQDDGLINETLETLSAAYGQPDFISRVIAFDYTDYYHAEMGENLIRRFVTMEKLIRPECLPDVKLATNEVEDKLTFNKQRRINIDPGYVSKAHLILATGKSYTHRPYLRDGIYADLTLVYQGKKFCVLPWTYPDYADEKQLKMLGRIREKYLLQLKMAKQ